MTSGTSAFSLRKLTYRCWEKNFSLGKHRGVLNNHGGIHFFLKYVGEVKLRENFEEKQRQENISEGKMKEVHFVRACQYYAKDQLMCNRLEM